MWPEPEEIPPAIWRLMSTTREQYLALRALVAAREAGAPRVGAPAPDFSLERLGAAGERVGAADERLGAADGPTGDRVRLSSLRGRPVALVFGSYT
jgi:hypothetical protein